MNDMPVGLTMALAEDEQAMRRFSALSDEARAQVISQASQAASQDEMQALVRRYV